MSCTELMSMPRSSSSVAIATLAWPFDASSPTTTPPRKCSALRPPASRHVSHFGSLSTIDSTASTSRSLMARTSLFTLARLVQGVGQRAPDVGHRFDGGRFVHARHHLFVRHVLEVGLEPPDVAEGVLYAADAVAPEHLGDFRD